LASKGKTGDIREGISRGLCGIEGDPHFSDFVKGAVRVRALGQSNFGLLPASQNRKNRKEFELVLAAPEAARRIRQCNKSLESVWKIV